jgi:hypothetical protein
VTESFLHYIWQFQYFTKEALKTSQGEVLQIFQPGIVNTNAGPDFSNARIKIDNLEWRGSVEIHIKSSGWIDHHHNADHAYEKVILHVVWEDDKPILRSDGSSMPTLELKSRVDPSLWERYKKLITNTESIPCANHWSDVPEITKLSMLDKTVAQRLEAKSKYVIEVLAKKHDDWEETCYQILCKNFGFKVNAEAMEQLAEALPYKVILKSMDKPLQVESLLLGQAGFLEKLTFADEYTVQLQREYKLLSHKFGLQAKQMHQSQWRFLRLRPANFPTVRLAQLAALLSSKVNLFSKILACKDVRDVISLFRLVQSEYWQNHYQLAKPSETKVPALGKASIHNLIINSIAPLLVAYGKQHDDQTFVDRAVDFLQQIPAEDNKIIRQWSAIGYTVKSAFDTQGLMELYNNYCVKRRCLECSIGMHCVNKAI